VILVGDVDFRNPGIALDQIRDYNNRMTNTKYGILNTVSNEIIWAGEAGSKEQALELARVALDRTKVPAAWHAQDVASMRADRQAQVAAWTPEVV